MAPWRYRAYGLRLESHFPLPGMPPRAGERRADVVLRRAREGEIARAFSAVSGPPLWETTLGDGRPFRAQRGRLGDRLFTYGDRATFHLSMATGTLVCDPTDPADPSWQRELLDTVLLSVSHQRGFELLHAAAVERPEGVVAIAAGTGGGKTSVVAELVRRGSRLFADDIVAFGRRGYRIQAHPGPPVANLPYGTPAAGALGTVLATFEDEGETWVAVDRAATEPAGLAAVVLLRRRPGAETSLDALAANPLHLLQHSVGYRERSERHRARFALFSDLAADTPIYRLRADPAVPPAALADLLERTLDAGGAMALQQARG